MRRKVFSVCLIAVMVLAMIPVPVLAEDADAASVQEIKVRENGIEDGVDADYQTAYATAGLTLSEQPVDGVYTLTIDEVKLKAVVDKPNETTYKILENENNKGKLWFGMEYIVPDGVTGAVKASVEFDNDNAPVEVALDNKGKNGFYNYIKVYDGKIGPVKEETAVIEWLGADGTVLATTKAAVEVVVEDEAAKPEKYTVTFESNGGSAVANVTVNAGEKVSEPEAPTKADYTFAGWYKDEKCETGWNFETDTVSEDITLYAKWESSATTEYTITFNANGGTVNSADKTTMKTEGGKLKEFPTPARSGYTFDGWYTAASGGDLVSKDKTFTEDTTLYAHWKQDTSTLPDEEEYEIHIDYWYRHGSVYTSHWYAEPGTWVTITVYPDADYRVDWVEVERENGRLLSLDRDGRRYTFRMPDSDVYVDVGFALQDIYRYAVYVPEPAAKTEFVPTVSPVTWRAPSALRDIPAYSWNYPAAQWAYQNGYLELAADGSFRLDGPVPHQQMWKIMAHWMGAPVTDDRSVTNWALQNGAAGGKPASAAMTRQNVVEYLYRCYFLLGGDTSVTGNLSGYRDSQLITSAPSQSAWLWAVNKGIVSGTADGYLNPDAVISRGDFATMLMRLCQNVMR